MFQDLREEFSSISRVIDHNSGCRTCGCKGCTKEDREYYERAQRGTSADTRNKFKQGPKRVGGRDESSESQESRNKIYSGRGMAHNQGDKGGQFKKKPIQYQKKGRDSDSRGHSEARSNHSNEERLTFYTLANSGIFRLTLGLGGMIISQMNTYPPLLGYGIPLRTQNYIMGESKNNSG